MPTFQTTATTSGTPVCLIARTISSRRALREIDHDVAIAVARCGRYSHSPSTKVRCRAAGSAPLGTSGARHVGESAWFSPHNRSQSGVAVHPLDEFGALVTHQRVGAIVTPENPFRGVAPCTVEAARTGADRPGCCLPAALRSTPCRGVGRQFVGRIVARASS